MVFAEAVRGTDASLHASGVRARPTPNPRNIGVKRKRHFYGAADIVNKPADNQQHENPAVDIKNKPADNQQHENPDAENLNKLTENKKQESLTLYPSLIPLSICEFHKEDHDPVLLLELAGVVLEHYRQRKGIEMEVVGKVKYRLNYRAQEFCYRLRFEAKFKDDNGSSPKRFFAEVFRPRRGGIPRMSFCNILDPNNPEVLEGCANCSKKKLHPYSQGF